MNYASNFSKKNECDYLIIGAGIIGLSIARELIKTFQNAKIVIIEKEQDVAYHSSGRNSGVLHAGFYYTADSLKAKFTRDGNMQLRKYCEENSLKINYCKKVVVAKNDSEVPIIYELEKRGKTNGVEVKLIDEKELHEIDPNVKTTHYALFSPNTATVDPVEVSTAIKNELAQKGIVFYFSEGYKEKINDTTIVTTRNNFFSAGKIINTAGLYADRIASDFGFGEDFTIIPFKGIYLKYKGKQKPVRINVYPVPNLLNPFLGVHFTVRHDGSIKIGPTSIPAFWRENYNGLSRIKLNEMAQILRWEAMLYLTNSFNFRSLAINEIKKYYRKYFVNLSATMVNSIDRKGFKEWANPGIRAQLLNKKTKELVMDFVVEGDEKSIHILNAVSPAFTCCFPFAKYVNENFIAH